jgi:membrane fusion protein (multidrug efflux system)
MLKVDRAIGDQWLILEGIKAGDRLILEGLQKIRPGMPVKVVPSVAKPIPAPVSTPSK